MEIMKCFENNYTPDRNIIKLKATIEGVCEAHLHQDYKPCVIGAGQNYHCLNMLIWFSHLEPPPPPPSLKVKG